MRSLLEKVLVWGSVWGILCLSSSLPGGAPCGAQELVLPEVVTLWPDGAPGAQGTEAVDVPTLTVFPAAARSRTGCGVVICPGGGYRNLAMGHEGNDIAAWLNSLGVSAYVLKYRLGPRYRHPAPMQDVQRAIRYVRHRAEDWGVHPERIGVLGFSAGGHLASTAATHFTPGEPDAEDPLDRISCRPDFAILCYPVISFREPFTHTGSRANLLGPEPDQELVDLLSNERQVKADTPPAFLFHTWEDTGVPPLNSVLFYQAMLQQGVPGELHVFQLGRHGVGLGHEIPGTNEWKNLAETWMRNNKWLQR